MYYTTSKGEEVPIIMQLSETFEGSDGRSIGVNNGDWLEGPGTNCYALALGLVGRIKSYNDFIKIAQDKGYDVVDGEARAGDIWVSNNGDHVMEIISIENGITTYRSTNTGHDTMTGTFDEINDEQMGFSPLTQEGSRIIRKK